MALLFPLSRICYPAHNNCKEVLWEEVHVHKLLHASNWRQRTSCCMSHLIVRKIISFRFWKIFARVSSFIFCNLGLRAKDKIRQSVWSGEATMVAWPNFISKNLRFWNRAWSCGLLSWAIWGCCQWRALMPLLLVARASLGIS